jgi:hypothetical protein
MGKPAWGYARAAALEHIEGRGEPGELKHLSTRRKRDDSLSSGERKGNSPNRPACRAGLKGQAGCSSGEVKRLWKGRPQTVTAR